MNRLILMLAMLSFSFSFCVYAQLYTGMSGLIHVPTAEMNKEGDARVGAYFLNKHFNFDNNAVEAIFGNYYVAASKL